MLFSGKKIKIKYFHQEHMHRDNGQKLPLAPSLPWSYNLWTKWQRRACHHVIHTTTLTLMFCPFSSYVLVCHPPTVLHPVTHLLNTAWPSSECLEKIGILPHLASGFCPNVIKVVSFTQMTLSKKSLPLKCHSDILPLF